MVVCDSRDIVSNDRGKFGVKCIIYFYDDKMFFLVIDVSVLLI